ncbi:MAG TPA: hypothetical protein VF494_12260 [Candidatus Limnocylindrales bacterium]
MSTPPRLVARPAALAGSALIALALVAGCARGPGGSPEPSSFGGTITHPTGATDLVLRVFVGGGFVPPGYLATEAPAFSLYGDGTAIFRDTAAPLPTSLDGIARGRPFQQVRLSEPAIRALLASALDVGGLRTAREQYTLPVADAPTTTFTIVADGINKQVSVNGLGIVPDTAARTDRGQLLALATLRDQLLAFGTTATGASTWLAERYRGSLLEATSGTARPWPWTTLTPETFANVPDTGSRPWPTRTMSRAEVAALNIPDLGGGAMGILLQSPAAGGPLLSLNLRPLLPDEQG